MGKVLVDTSVWIEFFKKKAPYYGIVLELMDDDRICCIGLILAELMQGAKSEKELNTIKEFLHVFDFLRESIDIWEDAGELSFLLQRKGVTVGLSDCYIAVVTQSANAKLLTLDKHFSAIQKEITLKLYSV